MNPEITSKVNDIMLIVMSSNGDLRTGQVLFNSLPAGPAGAVAGTSFDPFFKDLTEQQLYEWIDYHLITEGNEILGVFHNERIVWESNAWSGSPELAVV
jgi:hypothetical protein